MAYCKNCGHELNDGDRFCSVCGTPLEQNDMSKRQQEFAGKIVKCPNCGAPLKAFSATCDSCGYELRGVHTTSTVQEFETELKKIESGRTNKHTLTEMMSHSFGMNADTVDQQLADRISNFFVPNTREDIIEFLILAASNIDPAAYDQSSNGYSPAQRKGKLTLSNAWDSKYNQLHQKAKLMFPDDLKLKEIENLYQSKQRQIKKHQRALPLLLVGLALFWIAMTILLAIIH